MVFIVGGENVRIFIVMLFRKERALRRDKINRKRGFSVCDVLENLKGKAERSHASVLLT